MAKKKQIKRIGTTVMDADSIKERTKKFHSCELCQAEFRGIVTKEDHIRRFHPDFKFSATTVNKRRRITCDTCKKQVNSFGDLLLNHCHASTTPQPILPPTGKLPIPPFSRTPVADNKPEAKPEAKPEKKYDKNLDEILSIIAPVLPVFRIIEHAAGLPTVDKTPEFLKGYIAGYKDGVRDVLA